MLEINPVLAGTFDLASYAPAVPNFNTAPADTSAVSDVTSTSNTPNIDPRRYTRFDRSGPEAGSTTTFSFSDFLDMINPLQHIPVVSTVYRAITDEKINPVSRVAGDILYGGVFGVASAVMGAVGAAGDAVAEAQTGKDTAGNVIAALFGPSDKPADIQLAQADTIKPDTAKIPDAATPEVVATAVQPPAITPVTNPVQAVATTEAQPISSATTSPLLTQAKVFPLNPNKLPYGGVMDPGNSLEAQNTAIALSEGSHAMRLGHTIYTSRLMNGPHPMPVMMPPSTSTATASTIAASPAPQNPVVTPAPTTGATPPANIPATGLTSSDTAQADPHRNPLPQNLIDDMVMLKALNQYKGIAAGPSSLGATLDVTN